MNKTAKRVLVGLGALIAAGAVAISVPIWRFLRVHHQVLDDRLHVFLGGGGNTAVLITSGGTVVVDTKLWFPAKELVQEVGRLGPVRAIINTHYHLDHTHGNPLYPPGTAVHAAAPVLEHLRRFDAAFWAAEPARSLLPNRTFTGEARLDFGGETVRLVQLHACHTGGGDAAVLFEQHRVVHTGDVFFNGSYPSIDVPSGGSVAGCITALDQVLALPFDRVIPGHGEVTDRAGLLAMRAYYATLWDYAQKAVRAGQTPSQAAAGAPDALRGRKGMPGLASLEKNIAWAMDEARRP